jgi:acetyl-CoA acetyltransferase
LPGPRFSRYDLHDLTWAFQDSTAIAGIGETAYTKAGGTTRTELDLACEAIARAVADAGLSLRDVDGLCSYSGERATLNDVAQALGLGALRYCGLYPGGGNATAGVVHNAAVAVGAGTASTVVCYRSICQGQHLRFGRARAGYGTAAKSVGESIGGSQAFTMPFGLMSPAQMYALEARRHMHEFGTTSEHFGRIAVACYAAAQRNPRAVMRGRPLTLEAHQASRIIADPYRLFDCCQESDGACAVVVTSSTRAAHPVLITAAAQGMAAGDGEKHHRPDWLWSSAGMAGIAEDLYANAGIGPEDIDVAQIYENFTGQVLMALEEFGFCKRGEGGPFVASGAIDWPGGRLPLNTSGGNLAEAYVHGLSLVVEGVRQMRGTSTCQVENARHCLVVGGPGAPPSSALILRRAS